MNMFNTSSIDQQNKASFSFASSISPKPASGSEQSKWKEIGAIALGIIGIVGCVLLTRTEFFAASRIAKALTAVLALVAAAITAIFSATLFRGSKASDKPAG